VRIIDLLMVEGGSIYIRLVIYTILSLVKIIEDG